MFSARNPEDLDRFFRGLAEHAFHGRLGVVDPPLVDYVSDLLVRFIRNDPAGARTAPRGEERPGDVVVRMLAVVHDRPAGQAADDYRRIGDYTLFWSGVYPEAVRRGQPVDFRVTGKRAYRIASVLEPEGAAVERRLLARLSEEYDVCVAGLAEVRRAWAE